MSSFRRNISLATQGAVNYFQKRPFCVSFEVTYRCNARCNHCHLGGPVEEKLATPEQYGALCREIKPIVAQISGGEPLLRKDLEQIVQSLKTDNRAPYIVLTTNGILLTEEKYHRLRETGVDKFSLSWDFPDERHDEFRNVPGLFKRIQTLMEAQKTSGDNGITLSGVIHKDNFRELLRMAELAREWNTTLNFSTYTWLRTHKKDYLIPKEDLPEFKGIIRRLLEFKHKYNTIVTSSYVFRRMIDFFAHEGINNCRAGERFLVVNPDGSFSPCGLIIKNYGSQKEILENFTKTNVCGECYTSIRANTEKPANHLIRDSIKSI